MSSLSFCCLSSLISFFVNNIFSQFVSPLSSICATFLAAHRGNVWKLVFSLKELQESEVQVKCCHLTYMHHMYCSSLSRGRLKENLDLLFLSICFLERTDLIP